MFYNPAIRAADRERNCGLESAAQTEHVAGSLTPPAGATGAPRPTFAALPQSATTSQGSRCGLMHFNALRRKKLIQHAVYFTSS